MSELSVTLDTQTAIMDTQTQIELREKIDLYDRFLADPNNIKNIKKEPTVSRIPGANKNKGNGRSPKKRRQEV